jgi:hypothetical protein
MEEAAEGQGNEKCVLDILTLINTCCKENRSEINKSLARQVQ